MADKGYYGADSVSWKVFADPSAKLGGAASLLMQALNPMMMRVFNGTSRYTEDEEGRAERTDQYIDTTIFGDKTHADAAAQSVRRMHAAAKWTDPRTGEVLRADTPEWLAWTHNTVVWCILRACESFGPDLTGEEQNQFITEQHRAAKLAGIENEELLPNTREELDKYIFDNRDWMALTLPAAEVTRQLRKPTLTGNPINIWIGVNVQDGILSLLPDWALLLLGIEGRPMNLTAAAKATRNIMNQARKNKSTEQLIDEVTSRVEMHPYRKVRRM